MAEATRSDGYDVFLCYNGGDKPQVLELARLLRERSLRVFFDEAELVPGQPWMKGIEAAIRNSAAALILYGSSQIGPWAEREMHAFVEESTRRAMAVIPVFLPGAPEKTPELPPFLSQFQWVDLRAGFGNLERLLAGIRGAQPRSPSSPPESSQPNPPRRPWNAPAVPAQYLHRHKEVAELKARLLASEAQAIAVSGQHHRLGIQGMAGVGKTVLVAALVADPEVQARFPGGIFWLTVGRTPESAVGWQGLLAEELKGSRVEIETASLGKARLRKLFEARPASLLVLDDVWDSKDADSFNVVAPPSRLLITTRNRDVAQALDAAVYEIKELREEDALVVLAAYAHRSVNDLPAAAPDIVHECGELPLALAMAGSMLRSRPDDRWPDLLDKLKHAELDYLAADLADYLKHRNMLAAIQVSVQDLPEEVQRRYFDFAIFLEDAFVPESVPQRLWVHEGVDRVEAHRTVDILVDRSLVRTDENGRLALHDLQHDYVSARVKDIKQRHAQLIEAYRASVSDRALHTVEPDGYFHEHIARHLFEAEGATQLRLLLLDHRWLAAKLKATNVNALISEFELLDSTPDEAMRSLRDALRLSAHVLAHRSEELPAQLLGRLRHFGGEPHIAQFCVGLEAEAPLPFLCPLWSSLMPPGGPLLCSLEGHDGPVHAVALSDDAKTVVSASHDNTLKIWDVATARELRTLKYNDPTMREAVLGLSKNGKLAISGSDDGSLNVWDANTGKKLRTLKGHRSQVHAAALSENGKTAISISDDGTVNIWDVTNGKARALAYGLRSVDVVVLSDDGEMAVLGSSDGIVSVLDMATGHESELLHSHGRVHAVALSDDKKTLVGTWYNTLKIAGLEESTELRSFENDIGELSGKVVAVALSDDGRTAVSGSEDGALAVWDVEGSKLIFHSPGDGGHPVRAVALSRDGKRALCVVDGTLRVWDAAKGEASRKLEGHSGPAHTLALSDDAKTAVAVSDGNQLKVLDVATGKELRTFHLGPACREVTAGRIPVLALSKDGRMAITGSKDGTVIVWDGTTGKKLHALKGNGSPVIAVALSKNGKVAISESEDGTVNAWDVASEKARTLYELISSVSLDPLDDAGKNRRSTEAARAEPVALSDDGKTAVSGYFYIGKWNLETGRCFRMHDYTEYYLHGLDAVALSHDGEVAVGSWCSSSERFSTLKAVAAVELRVFRPLMNQIRILDGHNGIAHAVALSDGATTAVSASEDGTLKIWDVAARTTLRSLEGHSSPVHAVALSHDGKMVVSGSEDGTVKIWDVARGIKRGKPREGVTVSAVALSRNGALALCVVDGTPRVWDVANGKELRKLEGHSGPVRTVALSDDGKVAISGSEDGSVRVWGVERGKAFREFKGHGGPVHAVALSNDRAVAISGSGDCTVKAWSVPSGKEICTLQGHRGPVRAVALSDDGRMMVSGSEDGTLRVWDVMTGKETDTLEGHRGPVRAVALGKNGKTAASGSDDCTLKVWDLEKRTGLTLTGHREAVTAVALSRDGRMVVSGSWDKTLRAWTSEGHSLASFTVEAGLESIAVDDAMRIFAGDRTGVLHLLALRLA